MTVSGFNIGEVLSRTFGIFVQIVITLLLVVLLGGLLAHDGNIIALLGQPLFITTLLFIALSTRLGYEWWKLRNKYAKWHRTEQQICSEWYNGACNEAMNVYEDVIALRAKLENFRRLKDPDPSLLLMIGSSNVRLPGPFAPTVLFQDFVKFKNKIVAVRNAAQRINTRIAAESIHAGGLSKADVKVKIEALCVALYSSFKGIEDNLLELASGRADAEFKNTDVYDALMRLKHEFEARNV
jgi:hypothetical protein